MIKSFAHKGLELFYRTGNTKGIQANHIKKLRMQLAALDSAQNINDLNIPSYRLHALKGNRNNLWSITVNKNWRLTFEFSEGNVMRIITNDNV